MTAKEKRYTEIGKLMVQWYKIRQEVKMLKNKRNKTECTDLDSDNTPCFISIALHEMDEGDMCNGCKNRMEISKVIRKKSNIGKGLKIKATSIIKNIINNE